MCWSIFVLHFSCRPLKNPKGSLNEIFFRSFNTLSSDLSALHERNRCIYNPNSKHEWRVAACTVLNGLYYEAGLVSLWWMFRGKSNLYWTHYLIKTANEIGAHIFFFTEKCKYPQHVDIACFFPLSTHLGLLRSPLCVTSYSLVISSLGFNSNPDKWIK